MKPCAKRSNDGHECELPQGVHVEHQCPCGQRWIAARTLVWGVFGACLVLALLRPMVNSLAQAMWTLVGLLGALIVIVWCMWLYARYPRERRGER